MERTLQKVFATLSWCALTLASAPSAVQAQSSGCQVVKVSDGNLVQKGGGNTFDTSSAGGFQGSTFINGSTTSLVTVGNPTLVTPPGVDRSRVSLAYLVYVNGSLFGTYTFGQLQASPLVFNKPTNGRDTINVGLDLFERSGTQTNISQYRVTIDVSC